jgi:hypothetical protein
MTTAVLTYVDTRVVETFGFLRRLIVVFIDWLLQNSCNKKHTTLVKYRSAGRFWPLVLCCAVVRSKSAESRIGEHAQ